MPSWFEVGRWLEAKAQEGAKMVEGPSALIAVRTAKVLAAEAYRMEDLK